MPTIMYKLLNKLLILMYTNFFQPFRRECGLSAMIVDKELQNGAQIDIMVKTSHMTMYHSVE